MNNEAETSDSSAADEEPKSEELFPVSPDLETMSIEEASAIAADEAAAEENEEPQKFEMQLPLQSIDLTGAQLKIVPHPDGQGGRGVIIGPILVQFVMPLAPESAREVARQLTGGVEVARTIPPMQRRGRR